MIPINIIKYLLPFLALVDPTLTAPTDQVNLHGVPKLQAIPGSRLWNKSSSLGANRLAQDQGFVILNITGSGSENHPNPRVHQYANVMSQIDIEQATDIPTIPPGSHLDASYNMFSYYQIEIEVGTPGQSLSLIIDTGSSDLWGICSNACTDNSHDQPDCPQNTFNKNISSTWQSNLTAPPFQIGYQDGSSARGIWGTDVVSFGDVNLHNCSFGLAVESNSTLGIMGISFPGQESTPYHYSNVPQLLKEQGYIETVAYSSWLNDWSSSTGNILFGGIDHGKYSGTLTTIPIINTGSGPIPFDMSITMSNITINIGGKTTMLDYTGTVVLDSGTTFTYLPENMVDVINQQLNSEYNSIINGYIVPCDIDEEAFIEFNFSGAIVIVPASEFLLALKTSDGSAALENGKPICQVGVAEQNQGVHILGDTFLRSAYVVYDLENYEISLANTIFNSTSTTIEVLTNSKG